MKADATGATQRLRWRCLLHVAIVAAAMLSGPAAADERDQPFTEGRLWRISRAGVADSFVFGTIHVNDPRVSAIPEPVANALARSRSLLLELATTAVVDEHTIDLEEFDDGRRLETLVGTATFAQVHAELLAQGVAEDVIGRLKPWAAMLKTTRIASEDGDGSLDQNLLLAGRARRLSVGSLELLEEQVAAFDAIPIDSQVALLKDALAHREQRSRSVEPTIDAWLHGDLAGLAEMFEARCKADPEMEYHYRQLAKHLIEDRTIVMHHRLYFPLRQGRVFVAVGAMHLHGESGLLALLRQDGYAVTRMW